MSPPQHSFSYPSMGTTWKISIWDDLNVSVFSDIERSVLMQSAEFDRTYSRFIPSSLIWSLSKKRGIVHVPHDLVRMLKLYERFSMATDGKVNPLVGFALSDLGYDAQYSLKPKDVIRPVPNFHDALRIVDDEHIELSELVLIDLGALGKGYFVDILSSFLRRKDIKRFLVDGSGDIFYEGNGETIHAGLEDPDDATKVIGSAPMKRGSMCASGTNRRKWDRYHHVLDPQSLKSTEGILAVWVMADSAALADGLATCLFFIEPERLLKNFSFEYCMMNTERKVKRSPGFLAELY